jgi:hypothetical protein
MPLEERNMKLFATIGVIVLASCPGTTPIKELLDDPGRYDGEEVRIAGEVTRSVGVLGYGGYQVDDGTGTLTVVVEGGAATPRIGAEVAVEGTFRNAFTLGAVTAAVLVEERHRVR